jgi:hypothetical protein
LIIEDQISEKSKSTALAASLLALASTTSTNPRSSSSIFAREPLRSRLSTVLIAEEKLDEVENAVRAAAKTFLDRDGEAAAKN